MFKPFSITSFLFTFLLLLQCTILPKVEGNECVDASEPRTRVFENIITFQSNKIAFDVLNSTSAGNYVAFSEKDLDTLYKNSFISYDSEHILKLFLDNHHIRIIEDGAFVSLNCVMTLNLQKNQIGSISKKIFTDLRKLHELDLGENNIKEVPERVFLYNMLLRKLNLTRNHLTVLHPESFFNLSRLEELDLSYNSLYRLQPETFVYFHNLINLQLGSNQLERLDLEKFANLSELNVFNLSSNALESFDTVNQFSFGSSLTQLYLGDNLLTQLNPTGLRNSLPGLKVIDIDDNPWSCSDLFPILSVFNDSRLSYKGSTEKGPNIAGIACNGSFEEYKRKKWIIPVQPTPLFTTTKQTPTNEVHHGSTKEPSQDLSNARIAETLGHLYTVTVSLFVLCVILFVIDIVVKCGCLETARRWRNPSPVLDNDVETFSLLRQRF